MNKLSVVINTLNEEENIKKAILSVGKIAGEIVVVDMHSSDNTVEIAKSMGAIVYKHKKTGYVEPARNFAISKAKGDWILILDADEVVSIGLSKKLSSIIKNPKYDYYRIPRKNIIFGKWIKNVRWWPDYNIRLFKKGMVTWNEVIHSVPFTEGDGTDLDAKESNAITHYHYQSISQYLTRLDRYTDEHAKNLIKEGYGFRWKDLFNKPISEFVSRYFFGKGYKDGLHGLVLSGLQTFSEFVLYVKTWEKKGFKEENVKVENVIDEMKLSFKNFYYWWADVLVKEKGGITNKIKRKLKLP